MPKKIATEQDWINLGLQLFSAGGEESLVIERMAKLLGSSKTSFYWYFKTRDAFLDRIIEHWRELATSSIIAHIEANSSAAPVNQVRALVTFMFGSVEGKNVMQHLRDLGEKEPRYRCILLEIEEQRIAYMAKLLVRCGDTAEGAAGLSSLIYHYYLGWYERNKYQLLTEEETNTQVMLLLHFIEQQIK